MSYEYFILIKELNFLLSWVEILIYFNLIVWLKLWRRTILILPCIVHDYNAWLGNHFLLLFLFFKSLLLILLIKMFLDIFDKLLVILERGLNSEVIFVHWGHLLQLVRESKEHFKGIQSCNWYSEYRHFAFEVLLLEFNCLIINTKLK